MRKQNQRWLGPSLNILREGLSAKREGDTGRVLAPSRQGKAPEGRVVLTGATAPTI